MATTISEESTVLSHQTLVRKRLRTICEATLITFLPHSDTGARGVWNEDFIRKFMAIFELQRVDWLYESPEEHMHTSVIAKVIEELSTRAVFNDPLSETLLHEMEMHLRLLATALRLYKVHSRSLQHELYRRVYDGITGISDVFELNRTKTDPTEMERIEDSNVGFLIKHCQYLLISIKSSEPLSRQITRRVLAASEGALGGFGGQYNDIKPAVTAVISRQRDREAWHEDYVDLEDSCWCVFARDIRMRNTGETDIELFNKEAEYITSILCENLKVLLSRPPSPRKKGARQALRQALVRISESLMNSGPFEEHPEYFQYGILDLLYQLSFRIRKRSRHVCFVEFIKAVRMVLEHSPECSVALQLKATDLWNRITLLKDKDQTMYGAKEDCEAIVRWIVARGIKVGAERYEFSEMRSNRLQSSLRHLRQEEQKLFQRANDEVRALLNRPNQADEVGSERPQEARFNSDDLSDIGDNQAATRGTDSNLSQRGSVIGRSHEIELTEDIGLLSKTNPFSTSTLPQTDVPAATHLGSSAPPVPRIARSRSTRCELSETFTIQPPITLRGPRSENKRARKLPVDATCVSGSGKSIAIVREKEFLIYKSASGQHSAGTPMICGRFGSNNHWQSGFDGRCMSNQGQIVEGRSKCFFSCAAISDSFLVGAIRGSGCVLIFTISDESPGKFIGKAEEYWDGGIAHMILFNRQGTEFVVINTIATKQEEIWRFWKVSDSAIQSLASSTPDFGEINTVRANREIPVKMKFLNNTEQHVYVTRDAKFSQRGDKIVACTFHSHGTTLVTILKQNQQNEWILWGTCQIRRSIHLWDEDCWGFTGVDFFRERGVDDLLLFSVDFPNAEPKDCFRIVEDGDTFQLKDEGRICCGDGKDPSLAIAVSSHGAHDIIALIQRDGRVLLHKSGRTCAPVELGQINSIKTAELTSLAGIIRSLTISFTVDGQRLYIIDNRRELRVFNRPRIPHLSRNNSGA